MRTIGVGAFFHCGITFITIPNNVTTLEKFTFYECGKLTSVTIPESVETIGEESFRECTALKTIDIPNSVTNILNLAFFGCSGLTSIIIPNKINCIYDRTFKGCTGLTSVVFPTNLTSIKKEAFNGCTGLTTLSIPDNIQIIGQSAFAGCSRLSTVTIGNGIREIGSTAFASCTELADFYCYAKNVPATYADCFDGSYPAYIVLHVPENSVNAYKMTEPWSGFKNIVGDATGITRIHNNSVQIQQENGHINVEGVEEGTAVSVYDIKGVQIGSAIVEGGKVFIPTNLQTGNIAIVKIKDKSIKVTIK